MDCAFCRSGLLRRRDMDGFFDRHTIRLGCNRLDDLTYKGTTRVDSTRSVQALRRAAGVHQRDGGWQQEAVAGDRVSTGAGPGRQGRRPDPARRAG